METKKQQSNFWSKLAKSSFLKPLILTISTRKFFILAVCFSVLFSCSTVDAALNSGKIYQLQQRLIEKPRDKEALLHLAMEYSLQNNFVRAVETYFRLLRIDPKNFHAYNNLGIMYKKSGQFRDSIHCYKEAEKINPDSYWVPYNMGLCYESMGRMQEARESYGRALSLNPGFTQALQRLRNLAGEGNGSIMPQLPGLKDSQVYLVDGRNGQPKVYSPVTPKPVDKVSQPAIKPVEPVKKPAQTKKISQKIAQKKKTKVRTKRKGPVASLFNQAMEAFESKKMERAIELYARSIISDRTFLAEPENGIIKESLTFLKDRPNRMPDGLFYRGFFIAVSGNLELAVNDLKSYLDQQKSNGKTGDSTFEEFAQSSIDRYEAELAQRKAMEEEAAAAAAALKKVQQEEKTPQTPRASDFVVKRMSVDQIIDEANKLSRASRVRDAIAVLQTGLKSYPEDLKLLMKSANAYTDLMLLKGDNEAGKMAISQFEKVYQLAPAKSKEAAVASDMIKELKTRVR
jgi:tetratricopeptide (TPR) repeat protein